MSDEDFTIDTTPDSLIVDVVYKPVDTSELFEKMVSILAWFEKREELVGELSHESSTGKSRGVRLREARLRRLFCK